MATAVHMQPPSLRSSTDRSPSFDQPASSRSTPPFTSPYDRAHSSSPSLSDSRINQPQPHPQSHSRTSSFNSSPYQQPFQQSYFPSQPTHQMYPSHPQQAWAATPIPASAFYPNPANFAYPGQSVFHPGFQQSQADFAAWNSAYHQMVLTSMNGAGGAGGVGAQGSGDVEYMGERRRTSSGPPGQTPPVGYGYNSQNYFNSSTPNLPPQAVHAPPKQPPTQPRAFHPYKRGPSHRSSRENMVPRSVSQPSLTLGRDEHSPSSSISSHPTSQADHHNRTSSLESSVSSVVPPQKMGTRTEQTRKPSFSSDRSAATPVPTIRTSSPAQTQGKVSPAPTIRAVPQHHQQPLQTGPIANSATNTPQNTNIPRPSPLSQTMAASPEPAEKIKSGGLKGRFKKALDGNATAGKNMSTPPTPTGGMTRSPSTSTFTSPTSTSPSTQISTPPPTPSQIRSETPHRQHTPTHHTPLPPPSAPFAIHPGAMGSETSLAATERTATATVDGGGKEKGKRSLFRMKNMSTDNISLSSTVSSASMMIRKMGSIGKLARRNSLMGITKIFKDKPKDEDAGLPEKEVLTKKQLKQEKKDKKGKEKDNLKKSFTPPSPSTTTSSKSEPSAPSISRTTVEVEDDDRALAGLSPAAKLARQHTLRSKAEAEKRDREAKAANRNHGGLPSIDSFTSATSGPPSPGFGGGTEVVRVQSRNGPIVHHAVAVSEQEYDSADSSDGETFEGGELSMEGLSMRTEEREEDEVADEEFRVVWGRSYIDRNAVPKKGILKATPTIEESDPMNNISRQRSNSTMANPQSKHSPGPLAQPPSDAAQIDGLHHPTPQPPNILAPPVTRFESPISTEPPSSSSIYSSPSHNTSAPALSLLTTKNNLTPRSMTSPQSRRRLEWAPECAVYATYDPDTYDRRSEPATCNRLTPELAMQIKQEMNAFKLEMAVHPASRGHTQYFA